MKTLGEGFLATFDGPARAVRCASAMTRQLHALGLEVRTGLHTGEIEIGDGDIAGIAVHIAARIASAAKGGQVLVSRTLRDLVAGSELNFRDDGAHAFKGLADETYVFSVCEEL